MNRNGMWDRRSSRAGSNSKVGSKRNRRRLAPGVLALEDRRLLATFTVTSTADTAPVNKPAPGTLRWAVEQANLATTSPSTIDFSLGSGAETIQLKKGELDLTNTKDPTTIDGSGANLLAISGGGRDRIFFVEGGVTATLSGLTITHGYSAYGGGVWNDGTASFTGCTISGNSATYGGGLSNTGTAILTGCTISGNSAYYNGGGVYDNGGGTATLTGCNISGNSAESGGGVENDSAVILTGCTISGNSAEAGGGLSNYEGGTATLTGCTISGNSAEFGSGGVANYSAATLTKCTISGNQGSAAGGVYNSKQCTATLTECTISGNSAEYAGGLGNYGDVTVSGCTISGNSASGGNTSDSGGVANSGTATLTDTIVAGNYDGDLGGNKAASGSFNLIGTGGSDGLTNGVNGNIVLTSLTNLDLAPLGFYGGPTETMALEPSSAAIGKGTAMSGVTTDGRGFSLDKPVDIGAFQTGPLVVNTTSDSAASPLGELSLRQAVNLANVYSGAPTITFNPTLFATAQTITLGGTSLELSNPTGATETITGPTAGVTISGGGLSKVFQVDTEVTASFSGLTITGGFAANGAGVADLGTAVLTNCKLSGNSASSGAGLEVLGGDLTLSDCSITGSTTAIQVTNESTATISGTVIGGGGTGIQVGSSTTDDSTVVANQDDLSGEKVGVQNLEAKAASVNATFDWWGSSGGPGSKGASTAVGLVADSPWLGDAKSVTLATPDSLGFASRSGDSYVVTPNTIGPKLSVSLGGSPVGTVTPGGTIFFTGSAGSVTINGESGAGFSTDAFTITNAAVTFAAADAFGGASISFSGAVGRTIAAQGTANTFNVSGWTGTGTLTAPAGTGTVIATKNSGYALSNTSLVAGTMSLTLSGITSANLTDSGSGNNFTVTGWTGTGTLTGSSDMITATESTNTTLTNTRLTAGNMSLNLSGITKVKLTASAASVNTPVIVDASAFTGTTSLTAGGTGNTILLGGSGSGGTLTNQGSGNDILIGGPGADTLTDSGTGHNILIGGGGADTITGNGKDILISGTTSYDSNTSAHITALDAILAEWSSSDSYTVRINKIKQGITVNSQTYALSSSTVQPDSVASTVSDGTQSSQNNWFIVSGLDKVTKKSTET